MSVQDPVVRAQSGGQHVCQFFDTDESRADAVGAFLAEGLRNGERVLVVARPVHWAAIADRLASAHIPVEQEIGRGTLIVKDAMDTLRRLTRRGVPDAAAFDGTVGTAVRGLSELGPLRIFGEMVDILAQRGELDEAIALEALWNELGRATPYVLMCAYAAANFVSPAAHRPLRDICAAHSDVHCSEADTLAAWLLTAAHHPIAASTTLSH
jgi:hypothetical protein